MLICSLNAVLPVLFTVHSYSRTVLAIDEFVHADTCHPWLVLINFEYFVTLFFSLAEKKMWSPKKECIFLLNLNYQQFFRNHQRFWWGQVPVYQNLDVPVTTSDHCVWTKHILVQFKPSTKEFFPHSVCIYLHPYKSTILKIYVFSDFFLISAIHPK